MKKVFLMAIVAALVSIAISSCQKTCPDGSKIASNKDCDTIPNNSGSGLTGTWSKPDPGGSGIVFMLMVDDNTKTTKIGYSSGGGFTQTQTGYYTRTDSQITIYDGSCPGTEGVYNFTVNGNLWVMSSVNDPCVDVTFGGNRTAAVNGTWTKS